MKAIKEIIQTAQHIRLPYLHNTDDYRQVIEVQTVIKKFGIPISRKTELSFNVF